MLEYEVPYRPFGKAILDCLPKEGDGWVVPAKKEGNVVWRDREDLRDLIICSIDPPGMYYIPAHLVKTDDANKQDARTSMMHYTLGSCQTVISRRVSVS